MYVGVTVGGIVGSSEGTTVGTADGGSVGSYVLALVGKNDG